jgi:TPR repeat protein
LPLLNQGFYINKIRGEIKNMINNVKCKTCGFQGYNPNVPIGHVIDTCGIDSCHDDNVIGFVNGDTHDLRFENLYHVHRNVGLLNVDVKALSSNAIHNNHLTALMHYYYGLRNYQQLNEVLKASHSIDSGEYHYYTAKVFFNNQNVAKGVKHLKISAIKGYNPAKAEYGYIIATGKYGVLVNLNEGMKNMVEAAEDNEVLAGAYLADIYYSEVYKQSFYDDLSYNEWFRYIELGTQIHDGMANFIIGSFYLKGLGTTIHIGKAMDHLKLSADDDYVIAMELLVILCYNYMCLEGDDYNFEILHYGKIYLEKAMDKTTDQYRIVQDIFNKVLAVFKSNGKVN